MILLSSENIASEVIYPAILRLNVSLRNKIPELKAFFWPCWCCAPPEIKEEYVSFIDVLIKRGDPEFTAEERHSHSMLIRMKYGWNQSEDNKLYTPKFKIAPWVKPFSQTDDWFQEWGYLKDELFKKKLKDVLVNGNN